MISIPEKFLKEVDLLAQQERRNRSELLREALRLYLTQKQWQHNGPPRLNPRVRRAVRVQDELARNKK